MENKRDLVKDLKTLKEGYAIWLEMLLPKSQVFEYIARALVAEAMIEVMREGSDFDDEVMERWRKNAITELREEGIDIG